ncbi:MAG: SDR family oxidoreductase [Proteobacteria bacterium]|nr:SDR family oxidoreductase [Pseudomonadota bacterium]
MKTLVTGATGFIGSAVVRKLLASGREVRALVEPGASLHTLDGLDVEVVRGDVCDRDTVDRAFRGVRFLYHLAAIYKIWTPDHRRMYEVNVEGTKNVLFAAMRSQVDRVVHTSSIAAVGLPESGQLADETTLFNYWKDADHYIRSKWLSERDALRFAGEGVPVIVVNPAFVFGVGDAAPTPTGSLILEALRGRVPGYPGGGFNAVDVEDVAEAHVLAEAKGRVGERYIAGNHNVTYRQFYEEVAAVADLRPITRKLPGPLVQSMAWAMESAARFTQRPPRITRKAAWYAARRVWFDTGKAHAELGMPTTPLRQTIARAVEWFRDHGYV